MTQYVVTRQNSDGSYDSVGMNNRCIISGYKTYRNAFKYGINVFGRGKTCKVERYMTPYGEPAETFYTQTYTNTRGA